MCSCTAPRVSGCPCAAVSLVSQPRPSGVDGASQRQERAAGGTRSGTEAALQQNHEPEQAVKPNHSLSLPPRSHCAGWREQAAACRLRAKPAPAAAPCCGAQVAVRWSAGGGGSPPRPNEGVGVSVTPPPVRWSSSTCRYATARSAARAGNCLARHAAQRTASARASSGAWIVPHTHPPSPSQNDFGVHGAFPADGIDGAVALLNALRARQEWTAVFVTTLQHAPNHRTFLSSNPVRALRRGGRWLAPSPRRQFPQRHTAHHVPPAHRRGRHWGTPCHCQTALLDASCRGTA